MARRPACFAVILIGNGAYSQPFRQFSSGFDLVTRAVNLVSVDITGLLRRCQGGAYKEVLLGICSKNVRPQILIRWSDSFRLR